MYVTEAENLTNNLSCILDDPLYILNRSQSVFTFCREPHESCSPTGTRKHIWFAIEWTIYTFFQTGFFSRCPAEECESSQRSSEDFSSTPRLRYSPDTVAHKFEMSVYLTVNHLIACYMHTGNDAFLLCPMTFSPFLLSHHFRAVAIFNTSTICWV